MYIYVKILVSSCLDFWTFGDFCPFCDVCPRFQKPWWIPDLHAFKQCNFGHSYPAYLSRYAMNHPQKIKKLGMCYFIFATSFDHRDLPVHVPRSILYVKNKRKVFSRESEECAVFSQEVSA